MEEKKSKFKKVGAVLKGNKGSFIVLGNSKAKNEKYNYNVTLTLTDSKGELLAEQTNGLLSVFDPRKRPGITDEERERIPESVLMELFVVTD